MPRRAPRSDDPARSTHCVTPTQSHLVTAHASEATTTWAACAQRRPRYVGQARTVKNSPRSGIGTVKGRARECNRNGPNQGSSSVRAAPDIAKICTKPLISDRATGLLGVGCANPDISAEMTQASRPSRRDESLGELNDRCQGAWNRCCASSRPTSTRDSTASAAAPRVKGSAARSVAEKLLSTKSAGSIRPGGRPIPTRTLR